MRNAFKKWKKRFVSKGQIRTTVNQVVCFVVLETFLLTGGGFIAAQAVSAPPIPGAQGVGGPGASEEKRGTDARAAAPSRTFVIDPQKALLASFQQVTLEVPAGAVSSPLTITIQEMPSVQPMNDGMKNVTGSIPGFRFTPNGTHFKKDLRLTIPYDKDRIASAQAANEVYTYFYDEKHHYWQRLKRVSVDSEAGVVTSLTNHFTDFVNSTLSLPESPKPLSYNPNSIKDIKAADPGSGIPDGKGPEAGPFGGAQWSLPLTLPPGRAGMQPQLSFSYNSGNKDGWLGEGFDLSVPSISVDTRFGTPVYNGQEVYFLNGSQLVADTQVGNDMYYRNRVETAFDRIVRKGTRPDNYYFTVTDKNGTQNIYGTADAVLQSYRSFQNNGYNGIFKWFLKQTIDMNGNTVTYTYDQDNQTSPFPYNQTYLKSIQYTGHGSNDPGAYTVSFVSDTSREDLIIETRGGFETVMKRRLTEVDVSLGDQLIRAYKLTYDYSDFHKSEITKITEVDSRGNPFYSYQFSYYRMPAQGDGFQLFGPAQKWGIASSQNITESQSSGGGGMASASVGFLAGLFSAGISGQSSNSKSWDNMTFLDITGNGLPDEVFVSNGGLYAMLNTGSGFSAPVQIPTPGGISYLGSSSDNGSTLSGNAAVGIPGFASANASASITTSSTMSNTGFADINGLGFVDFLPQLGGSTYWQNLGGTSGFTARQLTSSGQSFNAGNAAGIDSTTLAAIQANNYLTDPVRRWVAYHKGSVTLSGSISKLDDGSGANDGERVDIFNANSNLLSNVVHIGSNPITYSIPLTVARGDRLYFKVSPVKSINNASVSWDPQILYATIYAFDSMGDSQYLPNQQGGGQPTPYPYYPGKTVSVQLDQNHRPFIGVSASVEITGAQSGVGSVSQTYGVLIQHVIRVDSSTADTYFSRGNGSNPSSLTTVDSLEGTTTQVIGSDPNLTLQISSVSSSSAGEVVTITDTAGGELHGYVLTDNFATLPARIPRSTFESLILPALSSGDQATLSSNYTLDSASQQYVLNTTLTGATAQQIGYLLWEGGYHSYDQESLAIRLYSDTQFSVTPFTGAPSTPEQGVADPTVENATKLTKSSYIAVDDFDAIGNIVEHRLFIHAFDADQDFNTNDFIHSGDSNANPPLAASSTQQNPDAFSGGIFNWGYGEWNDNYQWDETKLVPQQPSGSSTSVTLYFRGMAPDANPDPSLGLSGQAIWKGTETILYESQFGTTQKQRKYFVAYFSDDRTTPSAVGGDAASKLPSGNQTVNFDNLSWISQSQSSTTSVSVGAGIGGFGANITSTSGSSIEYEGLMDVTGSRYPSEVVLQPGGSTLTALLNTGSGFSGTRVFEGAYPYLRYNDTQNWGIGLSGGTDGGNVVLHFKGNGDVKSATPDAGMAAGTTISGGFNGTLGQTRTTYEMVDINGDGLPDMVHTDSSGNVWVKLNLGDGFAPEQVWSSSPWSVGQMLGSLAQGLGADTNADSATYTVTASGGLTATAGVSFGVVGVSLNGGLSLSATRTEEQLVDLTGDGLLDLVLKVPGQNYFLVKKNYGDQFGPEQKWYTSSDWQINSDGFDINSYIWHYFVDQIVGQLASTFDSQGTSFAFSALSDLLNGVNVDGALRTALGSYADDINPFGAGDVMNYNGTFTASLGFEFSITIPIIPIILSITISGGVNGFTSVSSAQMSFSNINGDGLPDQVFKYGKENFFRVKLNQAEKVGLLQTIQEPLGGKITLAYTRAGNTVAMPSSQYVLSSSTRSDGMGNSYTTTYDYHNSGNYDRVERTNYGYSHVTTAEADGRSTDNIYINTDFYQKGLLKQSALSDAQGNVFKITKNTYSPVLFNLASGAIAEFPSLAETDELTYDGTSADTTAVHAMKVTQFSYDQYGNVTGSLDQGDPNVPSDTFSVRITYTSDPDNYIVGKPLSLEVDDSAGNVLRKRWGTYDALGNLKKIESYLQGSSDPINAFRYDAYGNLTEEEDPVGYTIDYIFDSTVHSHIVQIKDSFGYVSTAKYDLRFGLPTSSTDITGNATNRFYDDFGRLVQVFGPYDQTTPALQFAYYPNEVPARAVTKNKIHFDPNNTDTLATVIVVDGLRRVIQTKKEGEISASGGEATTYGMNVTGTVVFDSMGRVWKEGQPVFAPGYDEAYWTGAQLVRSTTNRYDVMDRKTLVTLPDASTIQTSYGVSANGNASRLTTTVIDPMGKKTVRYTDVRENTVEVDRFKSGQTLATTYQYDAISEITAVIDAKGNKTTVSYDTLGRRTAINNPDSGLTQYFYDGSGNLIHKITANLAAAHKMIDYTYQFDRLMQVNYPYSPSVRYSYGKAGDPNNTAGRITSVTDESGERDFQYGKLGETVWTKKTLAFTRPFAFSVTGDVASGQVNPNSGLDDKSPVFISQFRYDYLGRMEYMVYPDGEQLSYGYDKGGQITTVTGVTAQNQTMNYVKAITYDDFGQRVFLHYGNDVTTVYQYDLNRRWLSHIRTASSQGLVEQDSSYSFDLVGDVLSVTNNGYKKVVQSYGYDDLYELVSADGTYTRPSYYYDAAHSVDQYHQSFSYDSIGNMLSKTSMHPQDTSSSPSPESLEYNFSYVYGGSKPHGATQIGNWGYSYDANGNVNEIQWLGQSDSIASGAGTSTTASPSSNNVNGIEHGVRRWGGENGQGWGLQNKSRSGPGGTPKDQVFVWDEENRMIHAWTNGSGTDFLYDYNGERTLKRGMHGETWYADKYYQVQNAHEIAKQIFVGDTRVVTRLEHDELGDWDFQQQNIYFYHPDHLGSTTFVTRLDGTEWEHMEYTPYGEQWIDEGTDRHIIGYRFTSKELDSETGLYYYGARYLDPATSRWMSADPAYGKYLPEIPANDEARKRNTELVGEGGVFNPSNLAIYGYSGNNPLKYVDPSGNLPVDFSAQMASFNLSTTFTSESFLPGSVVTESFGVAQGPYNVGTSPTGQTQFFQTTAHAGVDRVATKSGQALVSPLYLRVVESSGSRLTMNIVGTNRNISLLHLNPADVQNAPRGTLFAPGQTIAPYPSQLFGTGTGTHVHIQESGMVGANRRIINPDTHQLEPGATFQQRQGVSENANGPIQWQPWQDTRAY